MPDKKFYVEPDYHAKWKAWRADPDAHPEPEHVEVAIVEVDGVEAVYAEDGSITGHVKVTRQVREDQVEAYQAVYDAHVENHGEPASVGELEWPSEDDQ